MSMTNGSARTIRASADIGGYDSYDINTVVFDLDGTLVKDGSWTALFRSVGASKEHADMFRRYMAGEFESYMEWSEEACGVLREKGLTKDLFHDVLNGAP